MSRFHASTFIVTDVRLDRAEGPGPRRDGKLYGHRGQALSFHMSLGRGQKRAWLYGGSEGRGKRQSAAGNCRAAAGEVDMVKW